MLVWKEEWMWCACLPLSCGELDGCDQVGCWDEGYRWWDGTCLPDSYMREHHRALSSFAFENSASCHFCIPLLVQRSRSCHPVTDSYPKFFSDHPWPQFNIFPEPVSGMIEPSAYFLPSRSLESNAQLLLTYIWPPMLCLGDHAWRKVTRKHTATPLASSTHGLLCQILLFKHHSARLYNILITVKCQWVFFVSLKNTYVFLSADCMRSVI